MTGTETRAKRRVTFHVPPDANPAALRALLAALQAAGPDEMLSRPALLQQMARHMDAGPRGEVVALAQDVRIVERVDGSLRSTDRARALGRLDRQSDLVHALQYFAWSAKEPQALTLFWTYRTVVDLLWEAAPVRLDSAAKKRMVEELLVRAAAEFAGVDGFDAARTSIGPKTIDGVVRWVEALSPPVVLHGTIERRQTCPPQLVLIALAGVARAAGATANTDFRLGPDQRAALCRACFIAPDYLDRVLDWTVATQPRHVKWGALISTYGRQVVLARTDIGPEGLV